MVATRRIIWRATFEELNAQGQTIFMVTHHPENAALSHRIVNIRDGQLSDELQLVARAHVSALSLRGAAIDDNDKLKLVEQFVS